MNLAQKILVPKNNILSNKILKKMNFGSEKIKGPKKFGSKTIGHNRVSNSWDIVDIEFLWGEVGGIYSHFRVKLPTTLRLGCRWVGVVTIN